MGLTHLDAGVLIGFLDGDDAHHAASTAAIGEALHGGNRVAMATSAFAEALVGPARRGVEAVATVRALRRRLPIDLVPLDEDIAVAAARWRAGHRALRLPDAIVVATAIVGCADVLVTTDGRWPAAVELGFDGELRIV